MAERALNHSQAGGPPPPPAHPVHSEGQDPEPAVKPTAQRPDTHSTSPASASAHLAGDRDPAGVDNQDVFQSQDATKSMTRDADLPMDDELAQPLPRDRAQALRAFQRHVLLQFGRGARVVAIPLLWMSLLAFCGGAGIAAFLWLTTLPSTPNCQRLSFWAGDGDRLQCAAQAARTGDEAAVIQAIQLVEDWSDEHPLYERSRPFLQEWSQTVLVLARAKVAQGDLAAAIALAQQIPGSLPVSKEAKAAIAEWKTDQSRVQAIEAKLNAALKAQNWSQAETEVETLVKYSSDYWRRELGQLRQRIVTERVARSQVRQAQELKATAANNIELLGQAITLVSQVNPNTFAYSDAQTELTSLNQTLSSLASTQLQQNNLNGALAAAQRLPLNAALPADVLDLLRFQRVQQLLAQGYKPQPLHQQFWDYTSAWSAVLRMPAERSFASQIRPSSSQLEAQVQDVMQLQVASAIAGFQQPPLLQMAMTLAQGIAPKRPQRLHAQTLLAMWRQDVERAQDRPILAQAQQLAKAGTIKALKAASVQASKIPLGRALRPEAQAAIFDWNQQIQVLEDKPIMDKARALANQKQLPAAIQIAAQIPAGRALYPEAQAAIQSWTTYLQSLDDRPILDEANAFASQGRLGTAISTAYRIGPERALYKEAQAAIARWSADLEARQPRSALPPEPDPRSEPTNDVPWGQ